RHNDFQTLQPQQVGREQTYRTRSENENSFRLPEHSSLDLERLVDSLLRHTHRLQQYSNVRKLRRYFHEELYIGHGEFRAEPVQPLDPMLSIISSQAHIRLPIETVHARVRTTHRWNDEIAL